MTAEAAQEGVAPERVAELLERGEVELVDVRTPEEWEAARIPGARHIPFDELAARSGEIDRSRSVVLYCRLGGRSSAATQAFRASGWETDSMEGGIVEWAERGLPVEPEGGEIRHPSGIPPE